MKISREERATLAAIAEGTLHVDCLTRPRIVAALLDLGLIECDGDHFVATTRATPHLCAPERRSGRGA
jgi:hypothetical protein